MVEKIEIPGMSILFDYITGGDLLGKSFELTNCSNLYMYARNNVIKVNFDTSKTTNMNNMFRGSENAVGILGTFNTSKVTNMSYMFGDCKKLIKAPNMDTSSATNMSYLFYNCEKLLEIPYMDTSSVTNMSSAFSNCRVIKTIPKLDFSNVTNVSQLFNYCSQLIEVPDLNCSKVTNFGGSSYSTWVSNTSKLTRIGVIDCDACTDVSYVLASSSNNNLIHLGGFRNLGKASSVSNTNSNYFLNYAPNLTYESVINVLNGLYDRASAGLSVLTLKLHANHMALLSDEDKAIATNKGWTLS